MGSLAILKDKRLIYFGIVMATSFIYEVAWVRMFTLNFGITVYVSSVVIAAFMGGISIGAYLATLTKTDSSKLFRNLQLVLGIQLYMHQTSHSSQLLLSHLFLLHPSRGKYQQELRKDRDPSLMLLS